MDGEQEHDEDATAHRSDDIDGVAPNDRPRPSASAVVSHSAETAQKAVHQIMPRDDLPLPLRRSRWLAAVPREQSEDVESAPAQSRHRSIAPRAGWVIEADAAKLRWECLTISELRQTLGRPHLLSALVARGYGLDRDHADQQVASFFLGADAKPTSALTGNTLDDPDLASDTASTDCPPGLFNPTA